MKRSPVVVVVGHVDHGKTTLLDYIRKANIAAKEAGGITQSIGAYEVTHGSESITFIDTPGHEAFSKMRKRGAHIADVAILVVAADDGVQNQTKEAIKILRETETPFIVAINKIDKVGIEQTKVKSQLAQENVLLEGFGGSISYHGVSAKTGEGIPELLDLILLAADVEGLEYDPSRPASGYILESKVDGRKGITVSAIIKDGTLREEDYILSGVSKGKVRLLHDFTGKRVKSLHASSPALIFGFETLPQVGGEFLSGATVLKAESGAVQVRAKPALRTTAGEIMLNLILKADVSGSLEALSGIIRTLPTPAGMRLEIIEESVGDITEGDVKSAVSHKAAIVAFKSKTIKNIELLIRTQGVTVMQSEIIYELVKSIEVMIKAGTVAKALGKMEILAIFGKKGGRGQIIGGKVLEGEIRNAATLEISRADKVIGTGRIINLQSLKRDVQKVEAGTECGLLFESETEVRVGDQLVYR